MSTAAFACPSCHLPLKAAADATGRKVRCPRCGNLFLPQAEHTTPSLPAEDATAGWQGDGSSADPCLRPARQADELGRLASYRILKILGQGGMGRVYQAEDTLLQRLAALKVMLPAYASDPGARQRFLREARAAAALEHDNIVTIYQVGEDNGVPFLAMPLLKGESLEDLLRKQPHLAIVEVVRIGREIAEGLSAAHEGGLIHRDIKPGNLWLEGSRRRVKILDFGLARPASAGQDNPVTQAGTILGTPAYMAPEQARGDELDARADLFSLGCVLYRMLTGEPPFRGEGVMSILMSLASDTPPSPADLNAEVPPALSGLVMWLLAKDRTQRPASAQAVVEQLTALAVASEETVSIEPRPVPRARPQARRRRVLWVALALLILAPLAGWLAAVILRVETAKGTLIVEIQDDETEARIKNGKLILTGPDDEVRYTLVPSERNKELAAGVYKIHVEGADGLALDTREFTLKKGGRVTVRVTAAPRAALAFEPDRRAAEYVLSLGGVIEINDQQHAVRAVADLPRDAFRLTCVDLHENKKVNDAGLAAFQGCKSLIYLDLSNTPVGDAGLAHFKDCTSLRVLGLGGAQRSAVSDAGLAHFKSCTQLWHLYLPCTKVSDAGLAYFKNCKDLEHLHLGGTRISDAGLAHVKECKKLTELLLNATQTSDAGVDPFKSCKNLMDLALEGTKVTAAKIDELRTALPRCRISWNGGVVEPKRIADPERKAAEYALSLGGVVHVTGRDGGIRAIQDLPREAFSVTYLDMHDNEKVTDAGLAHFKSCKELTALFLGGTKVSDAGLAAFKDCKNLTVLSLGETDVGDAGMVHFKDCKNLIELRLSNTKVSDVGLAYFKGSCLPSRGLTSEPGS